MLICAATALGSLCGCGAKPVQSDFTIAQNLTTSADIGITLSGKTAKTDKPVGDHNPISSNVFFCDPTSVEYEGRLYVYGTNDQQEFDAKGGKGENSYGAINTLACYSTDDMVNWIYHGIIPVTKIATWAGCSWAPSIVSRKTAEGKTEFFLYFANSGNGVGVLKSDSPLGPWEDPIGHALIAPSTNELASDPVCWCFDPGAVVDDNGVGWLAIGGGNPMSPTESARLTGNCRLVRLGEDMVSLDSEIIVVPALYHFEANELNYINGKYVLTYCSNWEARNIWPSNSEIPAPTICSMCYMVSDDPLNPESWVYGGEYLANPNQFGYPTSNNHSHLQKFGDKYYLLYQNVSLLENMGSSAQGFRSIGIDYCEVDEENVAIKPASMSDKGVEQLNGFNPFEVCSATTAATTADIWYTMDGDKAIVSGNHDGSWIMISDADFAGGATSFAATVKGKGVIEIRLDSQDGKTVGKLSFDTGDSYDTVVCELEKMISGKHDLYLVLGGEFNFDEWQFACLLGE